MHLRGENAEVCVKTFFRILQSEVKHKNTYGIEIGACKVSVGRWITFEVRLIFHVYVVQFQCEY